MPTPPKPYKLFNEDCFDTFARLKDGSIDMVMVDPPYGTTACKWDSVIPLKPMWEGLKRVVKPGRARVFTASQPFTSILVCSNLKGFNYCWIWCKSKKVGFQNANRRPLKNHEDILVFDSGVYYPQGLEPYNKRNRRGSVGEFSSGVKSLDYIQQFTNYPCSLLPKRSEGTTVHPTQKPVPLMEYLIKTYTNEGDLVLDFAMGSGTTGVACGNLGRRFIGCDNDAEHGYFKIAKERIEKAYADTAS